jgi:deoxyribonuclease IV
LAKKPNILFGTAGIPNSTKAKHVIAGIEEIAKLGLDCMEIEFVHGVRMGEEKAIEVGKAREKNGVNLTVHAPYYINLSSLEVEKQEASVVRILDSARRCHQFGGRSVTFHPGFYQKQDPEKVFELIAGRMKEIHQKLKDENIKVNISPELTGKPSQFGSDDDLIRLIKEVPGTKICIDFSHYVARSAGVNNGYDNFIILLKKIQKELGKKALSDLHMHASGIEWTKKGERKHHPLKESEFDWQGLVKALVDMEVSGILICESPIMEEDALLLKNEYNKLKKGQ